MSKQNNQSGFGIVEVIILVVAILLIVAGGWYVWNANQKSSTGTSNNSSTSGTGVTPSADPYANWKLWCDQANKACFKYPSDWTITPDVSGGIVTASLRNPSGTVQVIYRSEDTRDGNRADFYTASITDTVKQDEQFKVVGGYVIPSGQAPAYWLVSGQFLPTNLEVGTTKSYVNSPRFVNPSGLYATFVAEPVNPMADEAASKAWFASSDAQTALMVIKSFEKSE